MLHFNVTAHPTAEWTAQQIVEAFPEETAPRFLLRDRDQIYGEDFRQRVKGMQIEEVLTAAHSPWPQRLCGAADWLGSGEGAWTTSSYWESDTQRCILHSYLEYYHHSQTHLSLAKDAPLPRPIQPPAMGEVMDLPEVGGAASQIRETRGVSRDARP